MVYLNYSILLLAVVASLQLSTSVFAIDLPIPHPVNGSEAGSTEDAVLDGLSSTDTSSTTTTTDGSRPTRPVQNLPRIALATPVRGQCRHRCIRKEASSLTPAEWTQFTDAVRQLNQGQGGPNLTPYEQLVQEHYDFSSQTHGTDLFFPYHRYFLAKFEQSLQQIHPEICVPYWDWSRTSQEYRTNPIFTADRMGAPNPGCFQSTLFPKWNTRQSEGACVSREFSQVTLTAVQFVVGIMRGSPNYSDFRTRYESQCHGSPHVAVGGCMSTMISPSDPIFWLHHSMNDKHLLDYHESFKGGRFTNLRARIPGSSVTVADMEKVSDWCYTYANSPLPDEKDPKPPSDLPDSWLKMSFGSNESEIEAVRKQTGELLDNTQEKINRNDTNDLIIPDRDVEKAFNNIRSNSPKSSMVSIYSSIIVVIFSILVAM